ncbi:BON domain-containing protein [Paraburkholderia sp. DHOC27]|uniref:BON domain-containing protein n=1 Tax=Paraburkholderia sp. DHOC27 TaxID=2303330 RepID=UPI000E3B63D8|nr:BON domain-containing protein [Paraburkholderia sp. DHOC27]RFU47592.1 BON domain-containing protein [Paraburkholderia sp. DHOC27]
MNLLLKRLTGVSILSIALGGAVMAPVVSYAQDSATTQRKANRKLAHDVRRALEKAQLDVDDVRILAKSGVVTLDGTVPDSDQLTKAPEIAGKVSGVTSLSNNLSIREEGH